MNSKQSQKLSKGVILNGLVSLCKHNIVQHWCANRPFFIFPQKVLEQMDLEHVLKRHRKPFYIYIKCVLQHLYYSQIFGLIVLCYDIL